MQTNRQNRRFCGTRGGRQMNKSLFKNHQTPTAAALGFLRHQGGESRSKGLRRKRGTRRGTVQLHHPVPHGAGTERQLVLFHLRAARGAIRAGTNSRKSAANNLTPPSKYPHSLRAVIWVGARRSKLDVFFVPGATLKVFATGNGSTKKLALAQPAQYAADAETGLLKRNGRPLDDNEVDAIWLARYTAAVDRGEEDFLGVYQPKAARKAERRARRAVAKAERKACNEVREDEEKTKRQALMASIKAMGQCCGVFRKPAPLWEGCRPQVRPGHPDPQTSRGTIDTRRLPGS